MIEDKPTAIAAGNWKMNGLKESLEELLALRSAVENGSDADCEILICPPFTVIAAFAEAMKGSKVRIGAQDCHFKGSGAHTGDISASMLKDAGATDVIVGHSERRADHGESSELICRKAEAVHKESLSAIICVGETQAEREAGTTLSIVADQLSKSVPEGSTASNTVIAYEPVWAIGTGLTPTVDDVSEVHDAIRADLVERFGDDGRAMRILYGGSVKPSNAAVLMAPFSVNGALVGGASLKAADFNGIIDAWR